MSKKTLYVAYRKESSATGRALFDALKADNELSEEYSIRRSCRRPPAKKPDVMIRWGNSTTPDPQDCLVINTLEEVRNCIYKKRMMKRLGEFASQEDSKIQLPTVYFPEDFSSIPDDENLFIRGSDNNVRYGKKSDIISGDKYASKEVEGIINEYRIHYGFGSTIGVYVKEPLEENVKIRKNDNCTFRRLDMSEKENRDRIRGVRPMMREIWEKGKIDFFAADVLFTSNGPFLLEINSAPGLNEPNIQRFIRLFKQKINDGLEVPQEV